MKKSLSCLLIIATSSLVAQQLVISDVITLVQGDKTYAIPSNLALQSGTLKAMLESMPNTTTIPMPAAIGQLAPIIRLMEFFDTYKHLSSKALLDTVEQEFGTSHLSLELLKTCDFLEFKKGINLIARSIAKNQTEEQITALPLNYQLQTTIAKYYFLIHKKDLPIEGINRNAITFSSQDYRDYQPEKIREFMSELRLKKLISSTFQGLPNLRELQLSANQLSQLDPAIFQGLTNLRKLYISENQVSQLHPNIFKELTNLKSLDLDENQLAQLHPSTFQGLTNLEDLHLSENQLSQLNPAIFQGLTKLNYLYLSKNQLSQLNPGTFQGLSYLRYLHLDENQLAQVHPQIFKNLPSLRTVALEGNPLTEESKRLLEKQLPNIAFIF